MPTNLLMPKWGMSMQEGMVGTWLKTEGDQVEQGEEIVEIESDKAINLVESPASGILARIVVPEGETVPITTVIAIIADPGEELSTDFDEQKSNVSGHASETTELTPAVTDATSRDTRQATKTVRRRVPASPAAKRLARQHDIDLNHIEATGPDGMIVVEDVQLVLAASSAQSTASPISRVSFYSQGIKLDGLLYLPKNRPSDLIAPAVVFCLGFTYVKDLLVPDMARRLSERGFAALVFDYRGFGKSEGPRGRLLPMEQVADIRSAVTYLTQRPEVDARCIGLAGISLGGSNALYTAAIDQRVRAVAAISPIGDARRWLKGTRRHWEWVEFLTEIESDRVARVLNDKRIQIDAWDIVSPDPSSREFLDSLYREFPDLKCELDLEAAEALIEFRPEDVVGNISPSPVLIVHGDNDMLVPVEESQSLVAKCGEPREFVRVPDMAHFDWANPQDGRFSHVMDILNRWFEENLSGNP